MRTFVASKNHQNMKRVISEYYYREPEIVASVKKNEKSEQHFNKLNIDNKLVTHDKS